MNYRRLGKTDLMISEIGFGAWGIGGGWGTPDDSEARLALSTAFDKGVNFYDTALGYGDGHSEELIGTVFHHKRNQVIIASKIPPKTSRWPVKDDERLEDVFPAKWIVECTETSLKNLGSDYLDLQQLHAWTDSFTNQPEWREALEKLKKEGKIRAYGVSANDWDPYGAINLVKAGLVDSVQVIYNIFEQRPQEQLLPAALAAGVGILARVPFEEGLLVKKITSETLFDREDWRAEWLTREQLAEAERRVTALEAFLDLEHPTLVDLALKFILGNPAVSSTIPGMRTVDHVKVNITSSFGPPLSPSLLKELGKHAFAHGWQYPWSKSK